MELTTVTDVPVSPTAPVGEPLKTPLPEIVEALKRVPTLQGLTDNELTWLRAPWSSERAIQRRRCGSC